MFAIFQARAVLINAGQANAATVGTSVCFVRCRNMISCSKVIFINSASPCLHACNQMSFLEDEYDPQPEEIYYISRTRVCTRVPSLSCSSYCCSDETQCDLGMAGKKISSMGQFDGYNLTVGSTSCLQQSTRKSLNIL